MKISDLFRFSADNLRRRKGRTVLTVIGVVVGVCAIVVMMSLGIAVNEATDAMLASWGDLTKITVMSYGAQQGTADLDDAMVENFRAIPHVMAATPMYRPNFWGQLSAGRNDRYGGWASIIGMDPDAVQAMGYELIVGQPLSGQQLGRDKYPVLIDSQAVFNFYDNRLNWNHPNYQKWAQYDTEEAMRTGVPSNLPRYDETGTLLNPEDSFFDPMKTTLVYRIDIGYDQNTGEAKYKEIELVPVGMINAGSGNYEVMGGIIMSMDDLKKIEKEYQRLTGTNGNSGGRAYVSYGYAGGGSENTTQVGGYDQVYVKVDNVNNMPEVEQAIRGYGYQISSLSSYREQLQGQVAQTQMMLGGLGAVSLLVAALNIANTMTMAIYERTKEIGVMKVLGCKLVNIRQMFLIESGAIGLIGGIAGVLFSLLLGAVLNYLPTILLWLGIEETVDIAGLFGLSGMTDMMPGMKLSVIPMWLVLLALIFATVVGLLSGIAPANRAVKISSLEAIRHE